VAGQVNIGILPLFTASVRSPFRCCCSHLRKIYGAKEDENMQGRKRKKMKLWVAMDLHLLP